jgi:hypothetical protein
MCIVILPRQLASRAGGLVRLERAERDIPSLLQGLSAEHPKLGEALLGVGGAASPFLGVFVDGSQWDGEEHLTLGEQSQVQLVAAVAGG